MTTHDLLLKAADRMTEHHRIDIVGCMRAVLMRAEPPVPDRDFHQHIQPAAALMVNNPTPEMAAEIIRHQHPVAQYGSLEILDFISERLNRKDALPDARRAAADWMRQAAAEAGR